MTEVPLASRLRFRRWREADRPLFAAMNADPRVMEHFPEPLGRAQSDAMVDRIDAAIAERGFGLWAIELKGSAAFIGFVGLSVPRFDAHFTPCVEVGWRLAADHWGNGYASEAAAAAVTFGFGCLNLSEIVSFTVPANTRSRRVMERLGMTHDAAGDFDHPNVPDGHPHRRHVLYRLSKQTWDARRAIAR